MYASTLDRLAPDAASGAASGDDLDAVCRAIADRSRRAILDALADGPRTTGDLAELFPTSRYATMKHLRVLVDAGLVVVRRRGRERWNHLNAVPLEQLAQRWLRPLTRRGAQRLLALKEHVESGSESGSEGQVEPLSPGADSPDAPAPPSPPAPRTSVADPVATPNRRPR